MKPSHIKIAFAIVLIILIFTFWMFLKQEKTPISSEEGSLPIAYNLFPEELTALDQFVTKHFMKNGLVQTNIKSTEQGELASGEDLLSESVGLMLQYYLKTDQEAAFEAHLSLANSLLLKSNGLYQWRFRSGQELTVSASVDDLRIIKALLLASEKWHRMDFKEQVQHLSEALLTQCVKDGRLLSYDGADAEFAPLYYYDFKTLKRLEGLNSDWGGVYEKGQSLLMDSRSSQYPLYVASSTEGDTYNMIENTLVALYLSEVGQLPAKDLRWFKARLKEGAIYGTYDSKGNALSTIESPAIYGIVAQIAKVERDKTLYKNACQKLRDLQYFEKDAYYGGFYDPQSQDAYSFDQLMGLLGY